MEDTLTLERDALQLVLLASRRDQEGVAVLLQDYKENCSPLLAALCELCLVYMVSMLQVMRSELDPDEYMQKCLMALAQRQA